MSFSTKTTHKLIRKIWIQYMIDEYNKLYSKKYGTYNAKDHSIRDNGTVVVNGKSGRETLEEVGLDYHTFRMKHNTSDNPLGI